METIAAELAAFVPEEMERRGVPGVAVALVREGRVAWAAGFGVADPVEGSPVDADTLFQVASNSKPVAVYAALALVAEGRLDLDAALVTLLPASRLGPSPWRDAVTLRRVMSHTSGMSNRFTGIVEDDRVYFAPGSHFSYSGHGYRLLEQAIEAASGEDFVGVVQRVVLEPLGMTSSTYSLSPQLFERAARGHVPGFVPAVVLLLAWLVLALPALLLRRTVLRSLVRAGGAALLVLALAAWVGRFPGPGFGLVVIGQALALEVLLAWGLRLLRERRASSAGRVLVLGGAAAVLILLCVRAVPAPLEPPGREPGFAAAGGLWATAPDLARFLAELMDPRHLDPALVAEMRTPEVRLNEHLSWGLGIGIQHGSSSELPDAIWHWGFNPGYYSLMVGHPEHRSGVVVLTNGGEEGALELARQVALRALGGEHTGYWSEVPGTWSPAEEPAAP